MANQLQSAMPGALLGIDQLIAYLLQHFWLLYPAIILFSAAELIAGLALMAGLLTRVAALATIGFSVTLQLMFGWQGGTCIDEWTMQRRLFARQRAVAPTARSCEPRLVPVDGGQPAVASGRGILPPAWPRGAGAGAGVQRQHLQLLPRLGRHALSQRSRQPDLAPLHAE
jgi:hypothetical protein